MTPTYWPERLDIGHLDANRWCVVGSNPVGLRLVVVKRDTEAEASARMRSLHENGQYHAMTLIAPTRT